MRTRKKSRVALIGAVAGLALVTSGCSSSTDEGADNSAAPSPTSTEPVTLTLATFNEFGYEDLITEYEAAHPNVTIEHKKAATSNEARDNLNTRLAAGSGASDIEAIEVDWLPELMQYGQGGADRQWMTVTLYLYQLGWGPQKSFGKASAVAWILFLIIVVIGLVNFYLTRRIASTDSIVEED